MLFSCELACFNELEFDPEGQTLIMCAVTGAHCLTFLPVTERCFFFIGSSHEDSDPLENTTVCVCAIRESICARQVVAEKGSVVHGPS